MGTMHRRGKRLYAQVLDRGCMVEHQAMAPGESSALEVLGWHRSCSRSAPWSFPTLSPNRSNRAASGPPARRNEGPCRSHSVLQMCHAATSAMDQELCIPPIRLFFQHQEGHLCFSERKKSLPPSPFSHRLGKDSFLLLIFLLGWEIKPHTLWEHQHQDNLLHSSLLHLAYVQDIQRDHFKMGYRRLIFLLKRYVLYN